MGKPQTEDRNMFPGTCRAGKDKKGLFSQESYITVGDKYIDEFQRHRREELHEKTKVAKDIAVFRPQNRTLQQVKPNYSYQEQNDQTRGKPVVRKLDEMGHPFTENTNMKAPVTIDKIYKYPGYMKDEFGRLRDQDVQARLDHYKAMGEAPSMRQMDHGLKTFSTDQKVYGSDVQLSKTVKEERKPSMYPHDAVFRYSNPAKVVIHYTHFNYIFIYIYIYIYIYVYVYIFINLIVIYVVQGYNQCFNRYQKYINDPYPIVKRKAPVENKKDNFK